MKDEFDRRRDPEKVRVVITTGSWIRALVVVVVALALFFIRDLALVVIASVVIASAIEPAAAWAGRRGVPRLPTIIGVYLISGALFAGVFYFLFLPLLGELSGFISQFPEYASSLSTDPLFGTTLSVGGIVDHLNDLLVSFSQGALSSATFFFGGITSFILIVILSFYLAVQ